MVGYPVFTLADIFTHDGATLLDNALPWSACDDQECQPARIRRLRQAQLLSGHIAANLAAEGRESDQPRTARSHAGVNHRDRDEFRQTHTQAAPLRSIDAFGLARSDAAQAGAIGQSLLPDPACQGSLKIRIQSSFMLTTVQPLPGASARASIRVPLLPGLAS